MIHPKNSLTEVEKLEKNANHLEIYTLMHFVKHLVRSTNTEEKPQETIVPTSTPRIYNPTYDNHIHIKASQIMYALTGIHIDVDDYKDTFRPPNAASMKHLVHGYMNFPGMMFNTTHIAHIVGTSVSNVSHHANSSITKLFISHIIKDILKKHADRALHRVIEDINL